MNYLIPSPNGVERLTLVAFGCALPLDIQGDAVFDKRYMTVDIGEIPIRSGTGVASDEGIVGGAGREEGGRHAIGAIAFQQHDGGRRTLHFVFRIGGSFQPTPPQRPPAL